MNYIEINKLFGRPITEIENAKILTNIKMEWFIYGALATVVIVYIYSEYFVPLQKSESSILNRD
jgi:hypothetical protein